MGIRDLIHVVKMGLTRETQMPDFFKENLKW